MYTHSRLSFFHEMCLLVKILEKRIEKDIRLMKKSKVKTIKNEKFALSQSLLDCLEIEKICRRPSSFSVSVF